MTGFTRTLMRKLDPYPTHLLPAPPLFVRASRQRDLADVPIPREEVAGLWLETRT